MLLLKNGTLYTMETDQPIQADLLTRETHIEAIASSIVPTPDMEVIDIMGRPVYPGFIDAHSHIGITEEKIGREGDDCNESTNPITPYLRAIDAINPMDSAFHNALAAGITGVMAGPGSANPIGGQFAFIKTYGRKIEDMVVKAPAAIKIAFGENPKNEYGSQGNMPCTRMGIAGMIRKELTRAQAYCRQNSHTNDFELECYRPLFAHEIPLKAHVHRTDDILTAIRIAREFDLGLTLDHCTEGHLIAEEIAQSGYPAIVGPSFSSRSKNEVSIADFKTVGLLQKAGIQVAITMDHPVTLIQYLPICAALAAKEGMPAMNALRAITSDAAKICGVQQRIGSLTVGKDADLVVYSDSPLLIESRALLTIVNGQIAWNALSQK